MTDVAEAKLRASGWFPGRLHDASEYGVFCEAHRLPLNEAATRFLSSYGGLHVPDDPGGFLLDSRTATLINDASLLDARVCSRVLSSQSSCVAVAYSGMMTVLAAESGLVVGIVDESVFGYGDDIDVAVRSIILRKRMPVVTRIP